MKFCIAIPHAKKKPGRKESLARLLDAIGEVPADVPFKVFDEPGPHWRWSLDMWSWGHETGADYFVTFQDDVTVPTTIIPALRAMLTSAPKGADAMALFGVHPLAREIARMGGRWHRSHGWILGVSYALSRSFLAEFVPWVRANEAKARVTCEDALANQFCIETGRHVFHCLPSLVEHDLTIPSTWADQAHSMGLDRPENHGHRKAVVSWQDYNANEITRADFWHQQGEVRLFPDHLGPVCWFCLKEPAFISSQETGIHVGPNCVGKMVEVACGRMLGR